MCGCIYNFAYIFSFSIDHRRAPLRLCPEIVPGARLGICMGFPSQIQAHLQGYRTCSRTCAPHLLGSCPSRSCLVLQLWLTCTELLWPNDGVCCHGYKCNATFLTCIYTMTLLQISSLLTPGTLSYEPSWPLLILREFMSMNGNGIQLSISTLFVRFMLFTWILQSQLLWLSHDLVQRWGHKYWITLHQ